MLRYLHLVIIIFAIALSVPIMSANATSFWEDLGRGVDKADDEWKQGERDGLREGSDDYRSNNGFNPGCPGGSAAYCAGFAVGYADGYRSASRVG
jgi:hypothetical protein